MNLTPEQQELGRRNFMRVLAGTPALAALGVAAATRGPVRGGPVRLGFIGVGAEGRVLLEQTDPRYGEVVALCDINPLQLQKADESLVKTGRPPLKHYADWKDMIQKERLEGVVIATPLSTHADITVGCLEAGLHVLCEKMMAWDDASGRRMAEAATRARPRPRDRPPALLQPGLPGLLRRHRQGGPPRRGLPRAPRLAPQRQLAPQGRPALARLLRGGVGLPDLRPPRQLAPLQAVLARPHGRARQPHGRDHRLVLRRERQRRDRHGGVSRFKDGREVPDHTYVTLEYPGGRTAVFTSIESNAFDNYYEAYYGTKGTLILKGEVEAYLFEEGAPAGEAKATGVAVAPKAGPVGSASESRAADAAGAGKGVGAASGGGDRLAAYRYQIGGFCGAIRTGAPLEVRARARPRRRPGRASRASRRSRRRRGSRSRPSGGPVALGKPPRRAVPDQAGVRLPVPARRHHAGRARPRPAARHRRHRPPAPGERHPHPRGAAVPAVRGARAGRAARGRHGRPHLRGRGPGGLRDHGGPRDRGRPRGGAAARRRGHRPRSRASWPRWTRRSPRGTTSAGRPSTATSTGRSTRSPGCPSCAR